MTSHGPPAGGPLPARGAVAADGGLAARRRLVAMVAHELRGPLAAAMGMAELLATDVDDVFDPPTRRSLAADVQLAVERVASVLDDVVVAVDGPVGLRHDSVDLAGALRARGDERDGAAAARLDGAPAVRGDPAAVGRILAELLANGRAPSAGRDEPLLTWREEERAVVVEALDSGPQILPEERAAALRRLDREPGTMRSRRNPGLGIELASVLAEAMGGAVEIDDAPGGGCIFRVRLPRR